MEEYVAKLAEAKLWLGLSQLIRVISAIFLLIEAVLVGVLMYCQYTKNDNLQLKVFIITLVISILGFMLNMKRRKCLEKVSWLIYEIETGVSAKEKESNDGQGNY